MSLGDLRCPSSYPSSALTLGTWPGCLTGEEGLCPQEGHSSLSPPKGPGSEFSDEWILLHPPITCRT